MGTSNSTDKAVHSEEIAGGIAQSVEQLTFNQRVQGSSPCALTLNSLWDECVNHTGDSG